MVFTRDAYRLVESEGKVRHLMFDEAKSHLAWVEGKRRVHLAVLDENGQCQVTSTFEHLNDVSSLLFYRNQWVVGDEINGLVFHDLDGSVSQEKTIEAGVVHCIPWGRSLVVLDGLGQLLSVKGEHSASLSSKFGFEDIIKMEVSADRIYIAQQNGSVHCLNEDAVLWSRPMRGSIGERITGMGLTQQGNFFLTREGHALVAGDEEAIELELWSDGQLIHRQELRMRLLTSCTGDAGSYLGFDNGEVHHLQEDGSMERVLETQHPIFSLVHSEGTVAASSWFFIHGRELDGPVWKVEHQGMAQWLHADRERGRLYFAGDDQNDYTDAEPIGCIDLEGELTEMDPTELSLWFTTAADHVGLNAEELYSGNDDDVLALLTESERDSMNAQTENAEELDLLLNAMGDERTSPVEDPPSGLTDDADLLDALNNPTESMLMQEDEDELFEALSSHHDEILKPQASAGDDQRLTADADGTCVVLLNGNGTFDPHQQVKSWSWIEGSGREIATTSQVRLKLPLGVHSFELRVVDQQGGWTSDRLTVTVLEGSTS
ncbi:hypothetical protein [Poseidonia sp.]|uniref:hypothetical protein n=1 Tax=Poseidonia sp. TaxID=2666344 RepID=UPI003F69EAA7